MTNAREAGSGAADRRLRLPQPALPGRADRPGAPLRRARRSRCWAITTTGRAPTRSAWRCERGGVEVLRNRHTTITLRHERLQVVGLDDAYTGHARLDEAVKGLRPDLPSHRHLAHRGGGGRPVAARRPAGAVGTHARRPGHAGAAARAGGRHDRRATATFTASMARAARRRRAARPSHGRARAAGRGLRRRRHRRRGGPLPPRRSRAARGHDLRARLRARRLRRAPQRAGADARPQADRRSRSPSARRR